MKNLLLALFLLIVTPTFASEVTLLKPSGVCLNGWWNNLALTEVAQENWKINNCFHKTYTPYLGGLVSWETITDNAKSISKQQGDSRRVAPNTIKTKLGINTDEELEAQIVAVEKKASEKASTREFSEFESDENRAHYLSWIDVYNERRTQPINFNIMRDTIVKLMPPYRPESLNSRLGLSQSFHILNKLEDHEAAPSAPHQEASTYYEYDEKEEAASDIDSDEGSGSDTSKTESTSTGGSVSSEPISSDSESDDEIDITVLNKLALPISYEAIQYVVQKRGLHYPKPKIFSTEEIAAQMKSILSKNPYAFELKKAQEEKAELLRAIKKEKESKKREELATKYADLFNKEESLRKKLHAEEENKASMLTHEEHIELEKKRDTESSEASQSSAHVARSAQYPMITSSTTSNKLALQYLSRQRANNARLLKKTTDSSEFLLHSAQSENSHDFVMKSQHPVRNSDVVQTVPNTWFALKQGIVSSEVASQAAISQGVQAKPLYVPQNIAAHPAVAKYIQTLQDSDRRDAVVRAINKGDELLHALDRGEKIIYADHDAVKNRYNYLQDIIRLMWRFYAHAITKGQQFEEGTFYMAEQYAEKISAYLRGYVELVKDEKLTGLSAYIPGLSGNPFAYQRISSHYSDTEPEQYGIDIRFEANENVTQLLPEGKTHILFGKNFIKLENYGIANINDLAGHTGEFMWAQGRKFLPIAFGSDEQEGYKKERVPRAELAIFAAVLAKLPLSEEERAGYYSDAKRRGICNMYNISKALLENYKKDQNQRAQEAVIQLYGFILELETKYGKEHIGLRSGNEVMLGNSIFTPSNLSQ